MKYAFILFTCISVQAMLHETIEIGFPYAYESTYRQDEKKLINPVAEKKPNKKKKDIIWDCLIAWCCIQSEEEEPLLYQKV